MASNTTLRVAARYLRAQEDLSALLALGDRLADQFLEILSQTQFSENEVAHAFESAGVTADDLNKLAPVEKVAGFGQAIKILGGLVLKGLWHILVKPFLALGKLLSSGKFRDEVKREFRRSLSHEVRASKHMLDVAGRLYRGETVAPQERKAAVRHMVGILVKVIIACSSGPTLQGLFSGGVWKAFRSLAAPIGEIILLLLNSPIQATAKKLMSADV